MTELEVTYQTISDTCLEQSPEDKHEHANSVTWIEDFVFVELVLMCKLFLLFTGGIGWTWFVSYSESAILKFAVSV